MIRKTEKPVQQLCKFINDKYSELCGIVYCSQRDTTKNLAYAIKVKGITCTFVHGGMSDYERNKNYKLWNEDKALIMCATKSFGMGIDKSDVAFVIHYNFPESVEEYYQQIGRVGRNFSPAERTLMFSIEDRTFHLQNLAKLENVEERKFKWDNLDQMTHCCTQNVMCRHQFILKYFSEDSEHCEHICDICLKGVYGQKDNK